MARIKLSVLAIWSVLVVQAMTVGPNMARAFETVRIEYFGICPWPDEDPRRAPCETPSLGPVESPIDPSVGLLHPTYWRNDFPNVSATGDVWVNEEQFWLSLPSLSITSGGTITLQSLNASSGPVTYTLTANQIGGLIVCAETEVFPLKEHKVIVNLPEGESHSILVADTCGDKVVIEAGDCNVRLGTLKSNVAGAEVVEYDGTFQVMQGFVRPEDPGVSLEEVAAACGFDHFNWYQRIVSAPYLDILLELLPGHDQIRTQDGSIPKVPFFDPPAGGFQYQIDDCKEKGKEVDFPIRDSEPWYWDEEFNTALCIKKPGFTEAFAEVGENGLRYYDKPSIDTLEAGILKALQGHAFVEFTTFLVGIRSNGQGVVLTNLKDINFRWRFTSELLGKNEAVLIGNANAALGSPGKVEFLGFIQPSDVTGELKAILRSEGICLQSEPCSPGEAPDGPIFDVDGNGVADALTDGLLVMRHLFQFSGDALVNGATAPDCKRCTAAEIEEFLKGQTP